MKVDMDEYLREKQLAFLGRLLSVFTHELKNHLAIINESSGLMSDLIELGKIHDEEAGKRLQKITASITERVQAANLLTRNLNSFGHRMDRPESVFSVDSVLREEMALLYRLVSLKGVNIKMDLQDDIPAVMGNTALFQFFVYLVLDAFLAVVQKGDCINIVAQKSTGGIVLFFEAQKKEIMKTSGLSDLPDVGLVSHVAEKLKAQFSCEELDIGPSCRLLLPVD